MYVCIECGAKFEDLAEARKHTNRPAGKHLPNILVPLKKHVIFRATEGAHEQRAR